MQQPKKQKYNKSKYKPTKTKSLIEDEYYSDPQLKNNFLENYVDDKGKIDPKIDITVDSQGRYTEKIGDHEYKIYKSKDKQGEYYSFYDPIPLEKNTFSGNKEIYDRIYIKEIENYSKKRQENLQKEKQDLFKNYNDYLKKDPLEKTHTTTSVNDQLINLKNFVNSPKYKEILLKQYDDKNAENIIKDRLNKLNFLKYSIVPNIHKKGPGYINGTMFPTKGNKNIVYDAGEPLYDDSSLERLNPNIKDRNKVYIEQKGYTGIPTHEFSHKMTNGNANLSDKDIKEIGLRTANNKTHLVKFGMNKLSNTPMDYYRNPTEVQARLNSTRMMLKNNKVYDPNTQDFTKEHLEFIKKNINNDNFRNSDFQDLIKTVNSEDDFIWMMNNIVQKNNKTSDNINIAAYGGNLKQQTNNNMLNEFNEGGTHEQNPLGGIPQGMGNNGQMNTVEQGETKKDSFIYSNRITLTPQVIAQFNLPKSLSGKTAADATKLINNKFEGRNSKLDNNTKKAFLDRIAKAQETVKAEEQAKIQEAMQINSTEVPDMMEGQIPQGMEEFTQPQQQMSGGGFMNSIIGQGFGENATNEQKSNALGAGLGVATTAFDLGNTAFGKTGIDTSGATDVNPGSVKPGMMGVTSALKGAQAGSMFGPIGTGVGAAVGLGAGLIGGFKAKKDALKAHQNFEIGESNKKISNFAFGGLLGEPGLGEPTSKNSKVVEKLKPQQVINNVNTMVNPNLDTEVATSRLKGKIVGIDEGVDGKYIYYKPKSTPGFNSETDRDYVLNKNWETVRGTDEYLNYLRNRTKSFAKGGNMYNNGGGLTDPTKPWMLPKSTIADDPNLSGSGPLNFRKSFTGVPYATELSLNQQTDVKYTPERGRFYKESFNQLGKPQLSNDLGFTSNLNYKESQPQQSVQPGNWYDTNNPLFTTAAGNKDEGYVSPYPKAKLGETLNKAGQYIKDNYGNALRYAPVAMNAYQLSKMGKPEVETLDRLGNRYNPQYMDERALTNQINAETNYTANALANASNGSLGSLSNNILGMQLNKTKGLSDAYSKIADVNRNENKTGQQFNLGVDQFNVGQSNMEKDINAKNRGAFKTERSKLLGQIGTDLGNIGKEEVYKKMAKESFGYTWDGEYVKDDKGEVVKDPETGKPLTKEQLEKTKKYAQQFKIMSQKDFGSLSLSNKNTKE